MKHLCLLGDANSPHVRRWALEMRARGWRVSVITARPEPIEGVEQRVLDPVRRSRDWLWRVGQARRHLEALAPDLVHAHYITSYGYLAARVAGRRPLVMTAWGSDILVTPRHSRLLRALTGWVLRRADRVTGDSLDLVDALDAYGLRRPAVQVHWGADMGRFTPGRWSDKPGFEVVSLRQWEPNYNVDTIVQAVAMLRARGLVLHLHLLGGGSLADALADQVRTLQLNGQVSLAGRVGEAEMVATLQRCKVSVSVPTSDATSVAVLESMACGLPVLASDLPANRQWLPADTVLPLRDPAALAAALERLYRDDTRAQALGQANLARMRAEGARSVQMDQMNTLYTALLENAR